ncbi:hypothetical protein BYT27DRAFT_7338626 [Phlegmacium glaucopus]|nr:hypothetical protein BYT27DRAFT_7338626 [Phlegmacium glaucopus]
MNIQLCINFLIIDDMDDMAGYRPLFERQKLLNSAVSLTALGAQFVTSLLMASLHQEKASWNEKEVEALVNYLWEHRAESGDGGTFKDFFFFFFFFFSPFRNKGWRYFENFQDIIPNASARGANAFSAMQTAPPAPLNETLDLGEGTIDEMSTNNSTGNTLINPMDIDRHESDTTSTFTSNSFGKRKLDVITSDEELNAATTTISENPIPLSSKLSSPIVSRGPAKKKTSSLPRSLPKSRNTSSSQSSQPSRVQSTSTKMTPTIIAHEIQGSINSLASAVRESGLTDPVAKYFDRKLHL